MPAETATLQPMVPSDVANALHIIGEHDEDDLEEARESYHDSLENQFILTDGGETLGVTGFEIVPTGVAWLSWHYLATSARGRGYGSAMLQLVLEKMRARSVRKVFASTSDYRETRDSPMLYGPAVKMYTKAQFAREIFHADYFDENEAEIIYSLRLLAQDRKPAPQVSTPIALTEIGRIAETEKSFFIDWEENASGRSFDSEDINSFTKAAKKKGAKQVFISFPSTMSENVMAKLVASNYRLEGRLFDYHADGVDELRFRIDL